MPGDAEGRNRQLEVPDVVDERLVEVVPDARAVRQELLDRDVSTDKR
jgi:hypothetical protein